MDISMFQGRKSNYLTDTVNTVHSIGLEPANKTVHVFSASPS